MSAVKSKPISNVTVEQAKQAAADYASYSSQIQRTSALLSNSVAKVREKYEPSIASLQTEMDLSKEILQVYANEQRGSWGTRKSEDLFHCTIGFKTSPPKLEKSGTFTWEMIIELFKKHAKKYLRPKVEIDKSALIKIRGEKEFLKIKEKCNVDIVQEEAFYVEPNT